MVFCEGICCDALFELRNVREYDERGSKSENAEGATVRISQTESIFCDRANFFDKPPHPVALLVNVNIP